MSLFFPASPSVNDTFTDDNGTIWIYTSKGAWRIKSLGRKLIPASGVITISPTALTGLVVGSAFSQALTMSGGTGPYTTGVTGGALPNGLSLSTNTISGTPTVAGVFNFEITATDNAGVTGKQSYSVTVAASGITLSPNSLPAMTRWNTFSQTITAAGGTAPYTYAASGLPAGLSLNTSTGAITGAPTVSGSYSITITATDSAGTPKTGTKVYTGIISESAIQVFPTSIGPLTKGQAVNIQLTKTGGVDPTTWGTFSGSLPAGLSMSSAGLITGTPTAVATSTPVLKATDTNGLVGARAYSIDVVAAATPHFYAGYQAPNPSQYSNGDWQFDSVFHYLYRKTASGWQNEYGDADTYYSTLWAINAENDIGGEIIYSDTVNHSLGKPGDIMVVGNRVYWRKLGYGYWDTTPNYYYDMYTNGVDGSVPLRGTVSNFDGGVHPYIYDKFSRALWEWNGASYSAVAGNVGKALKSFTGDGSTYANPAAAGVSLTQADGYPIVGVGSIALDLARPAIYRFTSLTTWSLILDLH